MEDIVWVITIDGEPFDIFGKRWEAVLCTILLSILLPWRYVDLRRSS